MENITSHAAPLEQAPINGRALLSFAALACLFTAIYLYLVYNAPSFLSGDEVFYYDQSNHLRQFEFVNFSNTQPLLYPFILSLVPNGLVELMRAVSAICAGLTIFLLGIIAQRWYSSTVALLACSLLGCSKFK